jgi:hypothetical protein
MNRAKRRSRSYIYTQSYIANDAITVRSYYERDKNWQRRVVSFHVLEMKKGTRDGNSNEGSKVNERKERKD